MRRATLLGLVATTVFPAFTFAQGPGRGNEDMRTFHALLDHRKEIKREIKQLANGVENLTESDNPEVTKLLQLHLTQMEKRILQQRPIHRRDPLFEEIFKNADKITLKITNTEKGVKILETSDDPYTVKLIKAHAEKVNLFIKNGKSEMHKDTPLPPKGRIQASPLA